MRPIMETMVCIVLVDDVWCVPTPLLQHLAARGVRSQRPDLGPDLGVRTLAPWKVRTRSCELHSRTSHMARLWNAFGCVWWTLLNTYSVLIDPGMSSRAHSEGQDERSEGPDLVRRLLVWHVGVSRGQMLYRVGMQLHCDIIPVISF